MRGLRGMAAGLALLLLGGCLNWFGLEPDYEAISEELNNEARDALEAAIDGPPTPSARNLELMGYHNGVDDSGDPAAVPAGVGFTELAVTQDYVYLARSSGGALGTAGTFGGFSIIDVREPADPLLVSHFEALSGSDVEVNADESLAFFATQRNTIEEMFGRLGNTMDPTDVAPRGIYVVDISDKRNPSLDHFVPVPYNGVHTIEYVQHPNGNEYVIACTYDLYANTVPSSTLGAANAVFPAGVFPLTQRVIIFEVQDNPLPASDHALVPVGQFQILESATEGRMFLPHDTFVQEHPETGQALLYVSYWDKGVQVLSFDDPSNPTVLDEFTEFSPSDYDQIHQAQAFPELLDGRHVTVAEPELPSGDETGQITILDTTDPTRVVRLGHWTQPQPDLVTVGFDHSPHNFDLLDGMIALSHNELGIWIIDVSTQANQEQPKTVGYYFPGPADVNATEHSFWGAFWMEHPDEGRLVLASDTRNGLHVLRYTGPRS